MFASGLDAIWGLFLIVIILGGIYGGIFTPTEAAAVAAVYAFLVATFIYRDMGPLATPEGQPNIPIWRKPQALLTAFVHRDTRDALFQAGKLTITLMFIIANALILKHVLTDEQIPQQIASSMLSAGFGADHVSGCSQCDFADWRPVYGALWPNRDRCAIGFSNRNGIALGGWDSNFLRNGRQS